MRLRISLAALFVLLMALAAEGKKKETPTVSVKSATAGLPRVTVLAADVPLVEIAQRLAKQLGTSVELSPAARALRVTTRQKQRPLETLLRALAPRAFVDQILTGGSGKVEIVAIHLQTAGEAPPSLAKLTTRSSDTMLFFGDTEDASADPFAGKLEVAYRDGRLHIRANRQPLPDVVARLAEVLRIPFDWNGEMRELIDVNVKDATLEQAMRALNSSVKLYQRTDLTTGYVTPVRLVVEDAAPISKPSRRD
jgi:hypothetical protein